MGAIATRMLGVALLKWVRLTARSIVAPRLIEFALKSNVDYTGANANNLTTDLTNIVAKYGATMPPQADITGYQNAVQALATILNDFKAHKRDFDLFKTIIAQFIKRSIIGVQVSTANKATITACVANAMHCTAATAFTNFSGQVYDPLERFFNSFMRPLTLQQKRELVEKFKTLVAPLSIATYTWVTIF